MGKKNIVAGTNRALVTVSGFCFFALLNNVKKKMLVNREDVEC